MPLWSRRGESGHGGRYGNAHFYGIKVRHQANHGRLKRHQAILEIEGPWRDMFIDPSVIMGPPNGDSFASYMQSGILKPSVGLLVENACPQSTLHFSEGTRPDKG